MKKLILLLCLLVLGASSVFAQAQYSAFSKSFLKKVENASSVKNNGGKVLSLSEQVKKEYLVRQTPEGLVVHGMIQGNDLTTAESEMKRLGVKVNSKLKTVWTVQIPVQSLQPLGQVKGIRYIDIDSPVKKKLDEARTETKVVQVNNGDDLPQGFTGRGVVIGVIDSGFDFAHPTFSDNGGNLRITRVWHQDGTGTPPSGFNYGVEYASTSAILSAANTGGGSHGSHVAGIAGGSGRNTIDNKFKGVAHNAELVLVEMGGGISSIADAARYIFDYAASVQKPCVINMSLGSHIGPHDGTSTLDQAFNSLVGNGRILVGAAGNEGDTKLHAGATFGGAPVTIATVLTFEASGDVTGNGRIELWGMPNTEFSVALAVYDSVANKLAETGSFSSTENKQINGEMTVDNQQVKFEAAAVASSPTNQRPNILIGVVNPTQKAVVLSVTSTNNTVHIWNHGTGNGTDLRGWNLLPNSVAGNTDYTVGEIGGSAAGVITVGAYTTKNSYVNALGNTVTSTSVLGEIASFSSLGPTLDGRVKPNITAPGNVVVSSVMSTDPKYNSGGSNESKLVVNADNSTTGRYAALQGTSMATPMMTGIIALMLEARPKLSPTNLFTIFEQTSRSDAQTGTIPAGGSNTWGRGKVDAHAAMKAALNVSDVRYKDVAVSDFSLSQNYPNPFSVANGLSTTINYSLPRSQNVLLTIHDIYGREIKRVVNEFENAGQYSVSFNSSDMTSGMYIYQLHTGEYRAVRKMMVQK